MTQGPADSILGTPVDLGLHLFHEIQDPQGKTATFVHSHESGLEEVPDLTRIMPQTRAGDPGLDPDLAEWVAFVERSVSPNALGIFEQAVEEYRKRVPDLSPASRYHYTLDSFESDLLKELWEREGQTNRALQVYLARRIFNRDAALYRRATFTAKPLKTQIPKEQIPALLESGLVQLAQVRGSKWGLNPVSFVLLAAAGVRVREIRAQLKGLSGGPATDRPAGAGMEEALPSPSLLRFVADTYAQRDPEVLRFAEMAVVLVRAGMPIRFAGVATAEELAEAQARLPDEGSRRMLADYVKLYDPARPETYEAAMELAKALVFDDPGQFTPELVLTQLDPLTVEWFLEQLGRLGIGELFSPELRNEVESTLTAA